jgi:hypothetical protein
MNESSEGFQAEFYCDYVILKNWAGDGWDIYSYDGTPEKVKKVYLEDEGYATLKDAKAEIDRLNKESNSMNEGHQVQTYKGYELDWNEDGIDPEEGTANFEVYIRKNGKDLTDKKGSVLTFHGFRQAREYIDNLPISPEEMREKNIELLVNLRDRLNKYFNSEPDLKDNYEASLYYQNNTAEFTITYWDGPTRNTDLLLVVYHLDTGKWELSFKDWDDEEEDLVDYLDSGKGYNELIDTIDKYSLSVFVVFGFDVQSLKTEDNIDKYSKSHAPKTEEYFSDDNESALKVGDNVYVITCKKNGKVKEINGEHITVETDNGKDPIRVDTYYENEVKKLDEAHYGGAFDIADDQYFTRDDLNDFAEEVLNHILEEFGLSTETSHIVNGHVPVELKKGETPIKCKGKLLIIDGGFSKAYHDKTGIAGYTLVANSHGMCLVSHDLFESKESAIRNESDIFSDSIVVETAPHRIRVADTDIGIELRSSIEQLENLLKAYHEGVIVEKSI